MQKDSATFGVFGTYRFLLAMLVFVSHLIAKEKYYFIGNYAVFAFFTLSGYTVAFILQNSYLQMPYGIRKYALNRFLRIYPLYWAVFALTLGIMSLYTEQATLLGAYHFPHHWFDWFCNLTLINFFIPLKFLTVATSWSLYNEMFCWMLMPWLLRSARFQAIFMSLGVGFILLNVADHYYEPDAVMRFSVCMLLPGAFFPFCAGLYIFKAKSSNTFPAKPAYALLCVVGLVALHIAISLQLIEEFLLGCYLSLLLHIYLIGWLSNLQVRSALFSKLDRFLGNLAYPIYLLNFTIILLVSGAYPQLALHSTLFWVLTIAALLAMAIVLHYGIEWPIERLRRKIKTV